MGSMRDGLSAANELLLAKLGGNSLGQLAQSLPSAHTADVHMLAAEEVLAQIPSAAEPDVEPLLWEAFHELCQTHSTLYHHRHQQKTLRHNVQKSKRSGDDTKQEEHLQNTVLPEDTKRLLTELPAGWTVCVISVGVGTDGGSRGRVAGTAAAQHTLHIARATTGDEPSVLIQTVHKCDHKLLEDLERIKEQNKVLNKDYADDAAKYSAMRNQLDNRLKSVVKGMESSWLGVWRCLLTGQVTAGLTALTEAVQRAADAAEMTLTVQQCNKLALVMCCPAVQLNQDGTSEKAYQQHVYKYQLRSSVALALGESMRDSRVQRLCNELQGYASAAAAARNGAKGPLLLVLDKVVVSMPWEAMSYLKNQAITRMPSLQSLHALYQIQHRQPSSIIHSGIDCSNGYYVLDPENNLPRTQSRLSASFSSTGWPGLCAQKPSHQQFKEALTQSDVFVYVGHGSGSQYLPGDLVEEVQCRAAVMLYGCSSARLLPRGRRPDPWGVLLNYLIANCPCVVGMLWEVTDKDTDLLTGHMLEQMQAVRQGAVIGPTDLPSIVSRSRHMCNRYLTASAITVHGLPVKLKVARST